MKNAFDWAHQQTGHVQEKNRLVETSKFEMQREKGMNKWNNIKN